MPRTDIDEQKITGVNVAFGENSTINDIVEGIRGMRLEGRNVSDNVSLRKAADIALGIYGKTVASFENWEKVIEFLSSKSGEATIKELEELAAKPAAETDNFESNKALNSQELKVLLAEYDKYREEKDLEKLADLVKRNPLLRQVSPKEIIEALKKKVELEVKEEKLGRPQKEADITSDEQLLTEARLKEQGIKKEKAEVLAEKIVQNIKEERTVTKEYAREVIERGENIGDKNVKTEIDKQIGEILRVTQVAAYEVRIEKQVEEIAKTTVERILPEEKAQLKNKTEALVTEKLREVLISGETGSEQINQIGNEVAKSLGIIASDPVKVAMVEAVKQVGVIAENNEVVIEAVRVQNNFDQMWADMTQVNPQMTQEQAGAAREWVREIAALPPAGIEQHRETAVAQITGEKDSLGQTITRTQAEQTFGTFKMAIQIARKGEGGIEKLGRFRDRLETLGIKIPIKNDKIRAVDGVLSIAKKDPGFGKLMARVGAKIDAFNGFYNGLGYKVFAKVGGEKAVGWLAGKIGGEAGKMLATEGLKIVAKEGIAAGLKNVFLQVATKAGIKVSATAVGGVVAKTIGLVTGASNPIGWALTALVMIGGALKRNIGKLQDGIRKIAEFFGINLPQVKAKLEDSLGKFGGGLAYYGGGALAMFLAIPTLIAGSAITALVAPVIIILFVGLMGYQILIQGPQISSIKPPEGMGGGQCVLKSEVDNLGGAINCNQNAPENSFPGISKAKFVGVANAWVATGGKNYSEECYNDVVNRALCAGKNPAYVLWAWAHESGASNYSLADVEDFGIHYIGKPKDFNAQITEFLTLDPGAYCLGAPKIGNNYWLGFATNYLNGSCDPDEPNEVSGQTGRQYLEDLKKSWSFVTNEPLPANIQVSPGGQGCGNPSTTEGTSTYDFVDASGNAWVCTQDTTNGGGLIPNFEPWDPNTPVPEGCPNGLPSYSGTFSQGPFAPGCSHQSMSSPAIDIGAGEGVEIKATHAGVVQQNYDPIYGFYVDLHGTCGGADFFTRYAHMPSGGFRTANGATVKQGDVIGVVDTTGSSTGNHIHYHITGLNTNNFGQYLGLSVSATQQLWGCCNGDNGKYCPPLR